MCGLIGFTGQKKANPSIIKKLMKANDSRGGHSTGYFDGKYFAKCIGTSKGLHREVRLLKTSRFIGHTRFSTHGETTLPNQHPFEYGEVIGAHNGVVHNYKEVGEEFKCKETEVDSQMIFKVLNKTNYDFDVLGKFTGALATLFIIEDKFYTYRKTNPLWVGRSKNGDVYFSSLKESLISCNLKNIYQLKEGRLYVWKGNTIINKIDIEHDPIESKYATSRLNWWEYNTPQKNKYGNYSRNIPYTGRGVYSGITDAWDTSNCDFTFDDEVDITDPDKVNEVDIYKAIQGSNPRVIKQGNGWSRTNKNQTRMFD